jgi:hypothetical protein
VSAGDLRRVIGRISRCFQAAPNLTLAERYLRYQFGRGTAARPTRLNTECRR